MRKSEKYLRLHGSTATNHLVRHGIQWASATTVKKVLGDLRSEGVPSANKGSAIAGGGEL